MKEEGFSRLDDGVKRRIRKIKTWDNKNVNLPLILGECVILGHLRPNMQVVPGLN
jgi:hypothetical protein